MKETINLAERKNVSEKLDALIQKYIKKNKRVPGMILIDIFSYYSMVNNGIGFEIGNNREIYSFNGIEIQPLELETEVIFLQRKHPRDILQDTKGKIEEMMKKNNSNI